MSSAPPPWYLADFASAVLAGAEVAEQLARSIEAARIVEGPIGLTGGLMRSSALVAELIAALERRQHAESELIVTPDAALQGAGLLAERHELAALMFPGLVAVEEAP